MRLKPKLAITFAVLKMESSRHGVSGKLARAEPIRIGSTSALRKEVSLENNAGQEAVHHLFAVASLVQGLVLWRKDLAMASIQLLVQLMGVGGTGVHGHTAPYNSDSALGLKSVKENVTAQNQNMMGQTVKEVK